MFDIKSDEEKLICLITKCKGRGKANMLGNQMQGAKFNLQNEWDGLQDQFYAPIDSGGETELLKQYEDENIIQFFERVSKQAKF